MNKIILLIPVFLLVLSCNKDAEETEEQVIACFQVGQDIWQVGEEVQISNCSVGASTYEFNFGNGSFSNEASPSVAYQNSGTYDIRLKATSESGRINWTSKEIIVSDIAGNYINTPVLEGDNIFPIGFGYTDNGFYYIENYSNVVSTNSNSRYNYISVDVNEGSFSKSFLAEREYGGSLAFVAALDNNEKLVCTVRSLSDRIGLKEIQVNGTLQPQDVQNNAWRVLYGYLENEGDYLYYGAFRILDMADPDFSLYKSPAIEIRNSQGDIEERKTYEEIEQGFIGDLIKTDNGFIAFGGITDATGFDTFENYRPLTIFLDNNYEYISHVAYANTAIVAANFNSLNGAYHIAKISNDSYVLYSHNEFRIINSNGDEMMSATLPEQHNTQGLLAFENEGFILTTKDYIHKYDTNGSLTKSLKFNGQRTPNLILNQNRIYFASSYDSSYPTENGDFPAQKTFVGAVDAALNIVDLNK